jgi:hypothetical protein
MRPKFWYCPLCGYMFLEGEALNTAEDCPMCGEEAVPCWECISMGVFDDSWCDTCDRRPVCSGSPRRIAL